MGIDSGLQGKVVLVTGGSRGIGRAIVDVLAGEGADVTFFYRENAVAARAVVEAAQAASRSVAALKVDIRDADACRTAVESVADRTGRIDILVNNAGVIRDNPLAGFSDEDVADVLATNVTGVFNVTRAVAPFMISKRSGRIINLSSVSGEKGGRGQTNYAASKGAINAFTKTMSMQLVDRQIRINAIAPGPVWTPLNPSDSGADEDKVSRFGANSPMKRPAQPEELAPAYVFLASNADSSYITGIVLEVMGGETTG